VAFLGDEPHTPIDVALRETLAGLGCTQVGAISAQRSAALAGQQP
jgi:hypothetical protein